jgi:hypothetical protein
VPITAGIGSAGSQPGVCTSITRPQAPYEGQVIYETDTNRTLVWDNAAWISLAQSAGSGMVQVVPTVSGSGTSVSLTGTVTVVSGTTSFILNCFNSTYEVYDIVLSDLSLSSDAGVQVQLRTGTTTSATGYYYAHTYGAGFYNGTAAPTTVSLANQTSFNTDIVSGSSVAAGGRLTVFNPFLAKRTSIFVQNTDPRTSGNARLGASGFHSEAVSYNQIVFSSSSNFTRCRVSVYGYNQ